MFNKAAKIYAIADQETCLENDVDILEFVQILYNAGIEIVQYRNKLDNLLFAGETFEEMMQGTEGGMCYIINDHEKLANKYSTENDVLLHAGQGDAVKNPETRYGRSTHTLAEVEAAIKDRHAPQYLAFGAMFASPTKPDVAVNQADLEKVMKLWNGDLVLIGGITLENISTLPKGDKIYYAVLSDFFANGSEPEQIEKRAKDLLNKLL